MECGKKKVTTQKQFECFVNFMKRNECLAKGLKYAENLNITKERYNILWEEITKLLNSLGPPVRQASGWQKVWNDYKLKIRRKIIHNKKEAKSTGGGPNNMFHLSNTEECVANMLSLKRMNLHGRVMGIEESPCTATSLAENKNSSEVLQDASSSLPSPIPVPCCSKDSAPLQSVESSSTPVICNQVPLSNKRKIEKSDLRKELLETQTNYLKEINDSTKECARYLRKIYYLKEKKFKLLEKTIKEKENRKQEQIKFQVELLEYKRKKLELLENKCNNV